MLAAGAWQASAKELVDTVTKVLALFVSITYVMGTLIVNSFLLTLGIRSTTLLSVEYISAGLPLALLFVVAGSTGFFFNRGQQSRRAVVVGLILAIALLGLIMLYITNLEDYPKTMRTTGLIYLAVLLAFYAMARDFKRRLSRDREKLVVWSAVYGLILLFMVVAASTFYGRTVYNDILPTIGGGAGSTVSFATDVESGTVLGELVPMQSDLLTAPIQLVRETGDSYLVILSDQTSVSVGKALVKGVIHHRTQGWELAPSIFD